MPIIRSGAQLIYYAHVPKCAGSAIENYLAARFGLLAFYDKQYTAQPREQRWTSSSPQHIDHATLARLFPEGFFDSCFTVVRHPVTRIVSAWHFHKEVEKSAAHRVTFSEWLKNIETIRSGQPFALDNHIRPMSEIVPENAKIFYLEHGLDAVVPWLDRTTGTREGPRSIGIANPRGAHTSVVPDKIQPSGEDLSIILRLFAIDFSRFGYRIDTRNPSEPAPEISQVDCVAQDDESARANRPLTRSFNLIRHILNRGQRWN